MVSLRKWNPNQLLSYLMEVNIYIGFWAWKWSAPNMGYMDKQPSRMQESCQGRGSSHGWGMLGSGGPGSGFFGVAPALRSDACNACGGYLGPLHTWAKSRDLVIVRILDSHPKAVPCVLGKPLYVVWSENGPCCGTIAYIVGKKRGGFNFIKYVSNFINLRESFGGVCQS